MRSRSDIRFLELTGLAPALKRVERNEVELVILLGRGEPTLESVVDASNLALFCTPAINLFPKRADRIHVSDSALRIPRRRRTGPGRSISKSTRSPSVVGHGIGTDSEQQFLPFYAAYSTDEEHQHPAYFTTRREPRLVSAAQKRRGPRSSYIGTEVFLALVDSAQAPFSGDLRQLSIQTLCTNRDLVLQMPVGIGKSDFSLDIAAPVDEHPRRQRARAVRTRRWPTAPWRGAPSVICRSTTCRSMQSTPRGRRRGAARSARAVRGQRRRERPAADRGHPVGAGGPRRAPAAAAPGPLAFGRGLEITLRRRRAGVRRRQRIPARVGARSILRASRVDQLVHRNRAAVREPRRNQPMGATMGRETDALAFFAALAEAPYRYDFYQTLRRLECLYDEKPRWGRRAAPGRRAGAAGTGSRSVVCAGAAGVVRGRHDGRPPRLQVRLFGLFGPNGPLPLHLTEYARERLRHAGDPTLSRFLDIFHHRFLALFYRAWAQAQPHVNRDRPKDGSLRGLRRARSSGMAPAAFRDRDALPDLAKFFHVGALIRQVRNAEGLAHILRHFFRVPVQIEEFVGHWLSLGAGERTVSGVAKARRSARAPCSAAASGIVSTSSGFASGR